MLFRSVLPLLLPVQISAASKLPEPEKISGSETGTGHRKCPAVVPVQGSVLPVSSENRHLAQLFATILLGLVSCTSLVKLEHLIVLLSTSKHMGIANVLSQPTGKNYQESRIFPLPCPICSISAPLFHAPRTVGASHTRPEVSPCAPVTCLPRRRISSPGRPARHREPCPRPSDLVAVPSVLAVVAAAMHLAPGAQSPPGSGCSGRI